MPPTREAIADLMAVALARTLGPGDFVGVGLGTPMALVSSVAARRLNSGTVAVLAGGTLNIDGDVEVWLGGPTAAVGTASGFISHLDSMDMAERQAMTTQFLRPAQVDGLGNLNTSRIGPVEAPTVRFAGGLATADVPQLLSRVVAYLPDHRPRNLPERVSWVTTSGTGWPNGPYKTHGVTGLITDLAVIAFDRPRPRLASIHPWSSADEVRERTGFDLDIGEHETTMAPTDEEMAALLHVDPMRRRDLEIRVPATT